jgi:hypothetical protein
MLKQFTLLTSRNKNSKKIEKKAGPEDPAPPPVNQGGGYSSSHKKVKPDRRSIQRSFK